MSNTWLQLPRNRPWKRKSLEWLKEALGRQKRAPGKVSNFIVAFQRKKKIFSIQFQIGRTNYYSTLWSPGPGLKVNSGFNFSCIKVISVLMLQGKKTTNQRQLKAKRTWKWVNKVIQGRKCSFECPKCFIWPLILLKSKIIHYSREMLLSIRWWLFQRKRCYSVIPEKRPLFHCKNVRYSYLLYRHECFTRKIRTKLHPGP